MAHYRNGGAPNGRECLQYDDDLFSSHSPPSMPPVALQCRPMAKRAVSSTTLSLPASKMIRLTIENQKNVVHSVQKSSNAHQDVSKSVQIIRCVPKIADTSSAVRNAGKTPGAIANATNDSEYSDDSYDPDDSDIEQPTSKYTKHGLIGQGTYGIVEMGKNRENGQIVAIKTIYVKNDPRIPNVSIYKY